LAAPLESVADTLKLKLPPAVGMPVNWPVTEFSDMPAGRLLNGATPLPGVMTKLP
jgi:hypothetical protein